MRRIWLVLISCAVLAACVTAQRAPAALSAWEQRAADLQKLGSWRLDGRAAVAVGTQGWQATLNWQQRSDLTEVHLSGPFGVGALLLTRTPAGLSLNGAAPSADVVAQLQERLGFELPMDHLRFWLLGVPDPSAAFELKRNGQDRASQVIQDAWTVDYDRYMPVAGDLLPAHVVLSREGVRVRIAVDHWELP
ncbi:MAG TPA: lipoprotein insertase outer membrane protein LolB [Steroidobacteraceae bacterium]